MVSRSPHSRLILPVLRRAHLRPYTRFLRNIGAPVDRYLDRAKLPLREEPTAAYMLNRGYFEFIAIAASREGIPDLGFQACLNVGRKGLDPDLIALIDRSPTLYEALRAFCRGVRSDATHIRVGLVAEPDQVLFWQRSAPEAGPLGWDISEQLVVSIVIDIVRCFAGSRWTPPRIRSRSPFIPTECREHLPDTEMLAGSEMLVVPIPRALLRLQPLHTRDTARPPPAAPAQHPKDVPEALREILKGHLRQGNARLEYAAEILGTSTRTLQRHLREGGTSFSRLVQEARYQVAVQLLADPRIQVIDVAYAAGYSDPANFSRSFRKMSGVTPSQYRSSLAGTK